MRDEKELEEDIDRFLSFFEEKLSIVSETDFKDSNNLFRKILYVGLIDALSKTVSSPKKGNRERVTSFVLNFTDWEYCDRVSLPHLVRLLEKVPDPEFSAIREYAYSLQDQWCQGEVVSLEKEPTINEIKAKWPKGSPKPLDDINLEHLQHVNLFYKHRNSIVHELREPGYGMEFKNDVAPFYHSMSQLDSESYTWELVYPLGFYEKICSSALPKLKEYYIKERIDPYSLYTFGTYWLEELNR